MPVIKYFVDYGVKHMLIEEYLRNVLKNTGYAGCELQKTPLGTRITIKTSRPGLVIGKKGRAIRELTEDIKQKFNIDVPTIDVDAVKNPELNASIQAERIAYAIEMGQHHRRAAYAIIRRILRSGARGVEVSISGKIGSQRARTQKFRGGVIVRCGTPAMKGVDVGHAYCILKSGVLGIKVKIMPKDFKTPDDFEIKRGIFDETAEEEPINEPDEFYSDDVEILEEEISEEEDLFESTEDSEVETVSDEETDEVSSIIEELDEEEDEDNTQEEDTPENDEKEE